MRLAYFVAPAVLSLVLVGCGNDEPDEVTPPPATTMEPGSPQSADPAMPPADDTGATEYEPAPGTGTGTGTGLDTGAGTGATMNPPTDDSGSGLGTASGEGTAPNTTGTGTPAN
ncbi:hypothetical protein [Stutzerimonas tarimensis]|uniref:Lipoprotein n=1 Tax=Stutzerimonas tarimensis TaxID=1507735 RepID=A0ABV7T6S4_9GAMM